MKGGAAGPGVCTRGLAGGLQSVFAAFGGIAVDALVPIR